MSIWTAGKDLMKYYHQDFCSELILEDISDKGYNHAQKVFHEYYTDIGDYHDFYV